MRLLTHRAFLKTLVAAVGGAAVAPLAFPAGRVQATYTAGSPSDTVDTNLTVQGNLIANQNVGIGVSSPAGKLDVSGAIYISGSQVIGTDGVIKQTYYAP